MSTTAVKTNEELRAAIAAAYSRVKTARVDEDELEETLAQNELDQALERYAERLASACLPSSHGRRRARPGKPPPGGSPA